MDTNLVNFIALTLCGLLAFYGHLALAVILAVNVIVAFGNVELEFWPWLALLATGVLVILRANKEVKDE